MFTVKRIIAGDRVSSEHNKVRLGDKNSRVFKEAMELLNKDGGMIETDVQSALFVSHASIDPLPTTRVDPETGHPSHYLSFVESYLENKQSGLKYLEALFPTLSKSVLSKSRIFAVVDHETESSINAVLKTTTSPVLIIAQACKPYPSAWQSGDVRYSEFLPCEDSDLIALYYTPWAHLSEGVVSATTMCHEICAVRTHVNFNVEPALETVLKTVQQGTRSPSELIGVMLIEEDAEFDEATNVSQSGIYELFYRGDEVYVTNSHGKTTDVLR